jgi:CrcB protein
MQKILLIALGGGLGSVLRYLTSVFVSTYFTGKFPFATFIINFLGCLLIGVFIQLAENVGLKSTPNYNLITTYKYLFITGFCGGFTTFSTIANENFQLIQSGNNAIALSYMLLSVVLGVLGIWIGMMIVKF